MRQAIRVGAAWRPIVIDEPVPMSGFAARTAMSSGMADPPLRASALALDDVVLVLLDVVGVDRALTRAVRGGVGAIAPAVRVHVAGSHTHAGPGVLRNALGRYSESAATACVAAAVDAASAALEDRVDCTLSWLDPVIPGVAVNRRSGVRSLDAPLKGLRWQNADGAGGVLLSYPCHPTALGPLNRQLSPDYPGFVRSAVEREWGGVCLFATGCAGDHNTGHAASASFWTGAGDAGRTLADAAKLGWRLARSALAGTWQPVAPGGVRDAETAVALVQQPLDTSSPAELSELWVAQTEGADEGVVALLEDWIAWADLPRAGQRATWEGTVSAVTVGDVTLVLLPGEPFLAASRRVDAALRRAITLGYAGDCPGYFPAREDYLEGGYEVDDAHRYYRQPAPFAPGSLETLTDAALRTARSLA